MNKRILFSYCDYSGSDESNECGLACCIVHNRTLSVTALKTEAPRQGDSVCGELAAILYSLEIIREAIPANAANRAVVYTDYSRISKLFLKDHSSKPTYESLKNRIAAAMDELKSAFPEVEIGVKYIGKHKKNNALHRMAHLAARDAIGK